MRNNQTGQISNSLTFTVTGAAPTITSISPSSYTAGSGNIRMTINGSGFSTTQGTQILIDSGTAAAITVTNWPLSSDGTSLAFDLNAPLYPQLSVAGTHTLQVRNMQTLQYSNSKTFTVTAATPTTLTSISPSYYSADTNNITMVVTGTGFSTSQPNSILIDWGTAAGITAASMVSSGARIMFDLSATLYPQLRAVGTHTLQVRNNQTGQISNSKTFTVTAAASTTLSPDGSGITPASGSSGSLTTSHGVWTFGGTISGGNTILLNGAQAGNGIGAELLVAKSGEMFTRNAFGMWYQWTGGYPGWTVTTRPSSTGPTGLSLDGSSIVPGSGSLTTSHGTWTFGANTSSGNTILLDGAQAGNGTGIELLVAKSGEMFTRNAFGMWYQWTGGYPGWTVTTKP